MLPLRLPVPQFGYLVLGDRHADRAGHCSGVGTGAPSPDDSSYFNDCKNANKSAACKGRHRYESQNVIETGKEKILQEIGINYLKDSTKHGNSNWIENTFIELLKIFKDKFLFGETDEINQQKIDEEVVIEERHAQAVEE